jgi:hypothetical protein
MLNSKRKKNLQSTRLDGERSCDQNQFVSLLIQHNCSYEILLSRFEHSRRYEIFTNDNHRETLEENSRLVDINDKLQKQLTESQEEVSMLKRSMRRGNQSDDSSCSPHSVGPGVKVTSAFIASDGKVPTLCPLGGCSHYEAVLRGPDTMKNFQNHMNNTHRVCGECYEVDVLFLTCPSVSV